MVLKYVQQMGSVRPSSLGRLEVRRVAAMLAVVEAAINVGGVTKEMLRKDGEEGEALETKFWTPRIVLSQCVQVSCLSQLSHGHTPEDCLLRQCILSQPGWERKVAGRSRCVCMEGGEGPCVCI